MHSCHIVCGAPAVGKTTYGQRLAAELGACFLDSDGVSDRLIRSGLTLAGLDPDDRDSAVYKRAYRDAVYETLFDLAIANLEQVPVVICGPFTSECGQADWPDRLSERLGLRPVMHFVDCPPELRRQRMMARGEPRDRSKLDDWDQHAEAVRLVPPVWDHHLVTSDQRPPAMPGNSR